MKMLREIAWGLIGVILTLFITKFLILPVQLIAAAVKARIDNAQILPFMISLSFGILLAKIAGLLAGSFIVWRWAGRKLAPVALLGLLMLFFAVPSLIKGYSVARSSPDNYTRLMYVFDVSFVVLVIVATGVVVWRSKKAGSRPSNS